MKNVILLGAPGSGKGTQSAFLIRDYGLVQISTGDILRAAVKEGTELGKLAAGYMQEGKLVPDDVIVGVMKDRLKEPDAANGSILDGFPRTIAQAEALEEMYVTLGAKIDCVISIEVPDEMIYTRITGRRSCPTCGKVYHTAFNPPAKEGICDVEGADLVQRADDTEDTLMKRLKIYHETTALLKPYYAKKGLLKVVDGTISPEAVYRVISEAMN
jgi:adenylate kinase